MTVTCDKWHNSSWLVWHWNFWSPLNMWSLTICWDSSCAFLLLHPTAQSNQKWLHLSFMLFSTLHPNNTPYLSFLNIFFLGMLYNLWNNWHCICFFICSFLRSVAYREFSRLVYGFLGNKRYPLPACAYDAIRKTFPCSKDEQFIGFELDEENI